MTPRDRVDWRNAPPIPEEYRELMDRVDRALEGLVAAQLGVLVHRLEVPGFRPSCPHLQSV